MKRPNKISLILIKILSHLLLAVMKTARYWEAVVTIPLIREDGNLLATWICYIEFDTEITNEIIEEIQERNDAIIENYFNKQRK